MDKFEDEAQRKESREIKINASLYAVPFYQHMEYKKTTGIRNFRFISGLIFQPMLKRF